MLYNRFSSRIEKIIIWKLEFKFLNQATSEFWVGDKDKIEIHGIFSEMTLEMPILGTKLLLKWVFNKLLEPVYQKFVIPYNSNYRAFMRLIR